METKFLVHPGKILKHDFLEPLEMTAYKLAKAIHVPAPRIYEIIECRRSVTADTAIRLARYFGTTPKFWLNIQVRYDVEREMIDKAKDVEKIEPYESAK